MDTDGDVQTLIKGSLYRGALQRHHLHLWLPCGKLEGSICCIWLNGSRERDDAIIEKIRIPFSAPNVCGRVAASAYASTEVVNGGPGSLA